MTTISYASNWTALTFSLASTGTSSTHIAGRESTVVDNTSNLYLDCLVQGFFTTGTTPTAGTGKLWIYTPFADLTTPVYPDVLDGTDSAETFTSVGIRDGCLHFVDSVATDTTSNRTYTFKQFSIVDVVGNMPAHWGLFFAHDTGAALNATAGNHNFEYLGIKTA